MNFTQDQWKEILELNEAIKELDPVLKERLVEYGSRRILKDEYVNMKAITEERERGEVSEGSTEKCVQLAKKGKAYRQLGNSLKINRLVLQLRQSPYLVSIWSVMKCLLNFQKKIFQMHISRLV